MALQGKELLAAVKQLTAENQSKSAIAKACGYARVVANGERAGSTIPDVQSFSAALLDAQGFTFGGTGRSYAPRGVVRKTKAGLLIVGSSYHVDVEPGTEYKVIQEEDGAIVLEPVAAKAQGGNGKGANAVREAVAV